MNQKEVSELRRRFRPDKSAVSRIYGCYVSASGEIAAVLDEPLSLNLWGPCPRTRWRSTFRF